MSIKKIFCFTLSFSLIAFAAHAQNVFSVKGRFTSLKEEKKVFLSYWLSGKSILDSTITKNGVFSFKGRIGNEVIKASISLKPIQDDPSISLLEKIQATDEQGFFLEKGLTQVRGTNFAKNAVIKGGAAQKEYQLFQTSIKADMDQLALAEAEILPIVIKAQGKGLDTNQRIKAIQKITVPLAKRIDEEEIDFIAAHTDSYVSLDLVQKRSGIIHPETFEPLFNSLSIRLRNTEVGKSLAKRLDVTKKTGIGVTATDFSQSDVNGKMVSLSSFKGEYVLLDFWASWCGPCRAENPNVLKAYNRFKGKNFDILAVSLDNKKESWLKAIKDDGLPWTQVSDLQGWKNQVAGFYAISAIPQNFLIDPNGVIIATNLYGEALMKKLEELIK
ncbi:TlpA disulfide reductase family protein [Mucilaginibacter sp. L196]|uniref:TlpA disulfide reductase family protein n=1 Tax=Mucilaginibacter sp. L196 TaxID=1641870 RepID=UPI00131C7DE0|nr:TlpA disulfide reductase family protein [Mucilaginibacter sp. L196]